MAVLKGMRGADLIGRDCITDAPAFMSTKLPKRTDTPIWAPCRQKLDLHLVISLLSHRVANRCESAQL